VYYSDVNPLDFTDALMMEYLLYLSKSLVQGEFYKPSSDGIAIYLDGGKDMNSILERVEKAGGLIFRLASNSCTPQLKATLFMKLLVQFPEPNRAFIAFFTIRSTRAVINGAGRSCPIPFIISRSAPGILAATSFPASGVTSGSSLP
jgi:hypothetical protein